MPHLINHVHKVAQGSALNAIRARKLNDGDWSRHIRSHSPIAVTDVPHQLTGPCTHIIRANIKENFPKEYVEFMHTLAEIFAKQAVAKVMTDDSVWSGLNNHAKADLGEFFITQIVIGTMDDEWVHIQEVLEGVCESVGYSYPEVKQLHKKFTNAFAIYLFHATDNSASYFTGGLK